MILGASIVMFLSAAFNVIAWPRFYARVVKDPRARDSNGAATTFLKVHLILTVIGLTLAAALVVFGVLILIR